MATKNYDGYTTGLPMGRSAIATVRVGEAYIDFTLAANQLAGVTDSLELFQLPKGAVILCAGIEQLVAGTATNTLIARVGTVSLSATLAGDAAAGVVTAHADVSGGAPQILAAAANFNLLCATAVRVAGKARAFVVYIEGLHDTGAPKVAARDATTGLA